MRIGSVDLDHDVLVVAEIGNNHEGSFDVARTLVERAAECGAQAVKFQTFQTRYFVHPRDTARYQRLASFEISYRDFERLCEFARSLNLQFLSTPLDLESARFLRNLVDAYKIASGDNDFYPLLEYVCGTGKPIVISSGLSDLAHIARSKEFIEEQWRRRGIDQELAVLHCVSSYPVPPEQANLMAVPFLAEQLGCTVGYSDHTVGWMACVVAVALGARIVEKHFTLDKRYSDFHDHQLSADPQELRRLVAEIALVRKMGGKPQKTVQESEAASLQAIRRSIVAARDLARGHRVELSDLMWIRPAIGLRPGEEARLLGRTLKRDVAFGDPILAHDVE